MKSLPKSKDSPLRVQPRWPYRYVHIADGTYAKLLKAQENLSAQNIQLILTRGLENEGAFRKTFHFTGRCLGAVSFFLLFPWRVGELKDIFSTNGHTHKGKGNCIDVSISYDKRVINLLPLGVFTTSRQIATIHERHHAVLHSVWQALRLAGFSLHPNPTEALQIHCEG